MRHGAPGNSRRPWQSGRFVDRGVVPDGDMQGSRVRWATLGTIESDQLHLLPPLDEAWLRRRTVELFRLWQRDRAVTLQEPLSATAWNKDQGQAPAER